MVPTYGLEKSAAGLLGGLGENSVAPRLDQGRIYVTGWGPAQAIERSVPPTWNSQVRATTGDLSLGWDDPNAASVANNGEEK